MTLASAEKGKTRVIKKVAGQNKVKGFLEVLGFTEGSRVVVIAAFNGNLIVAVKDSRIAISKDLAKKIFLQ